jgi:HlyD family secretion protein
LKRPPRKVLLIAAALVAVAAVSVILLRSGDGDLRYATAAVDRGDIADVVGATGTLQSVTTVQVGSQVSGTIQQLMVDFNSRVQKGQVIARLDPSLFDARLGQAQANLVSARANVERSQAALEDARQKLQRARALSQEDLLPASDLETAQANDRAAAAQVKASQAAVTQAAAAVNQAQVDLGHTVIRAPIDGIVVARNVDVGQTVAASLQAPTLFVIAQDLSQMQVVASIDEADIGRVHTGQKATFRVDSFPEQTFEGRVEQVRLQPTTVQNVVTYSAIISVENPGQRLMPGMTATVSLVSRERPNVLRIPAAALRFRPPETAAGEGAAVRAEGGGGRPAAGAGGQGPGGQGPPGQGEGRRFRRQREGGGQARGAAGDGGGAGGRDGAAPEGGGEADRGRPGVVFVPGPDGAPQPRRIRVGLSDGQFVEVVTGLEEGTQVITGQEQGDARAAGARGASPTPANPFAPGGRGQRRQR